MITKLLLTVTTAVFLTAALCEAQSSPPHQLAVRFASHEVTVTGLTPGGQAILFGIGVRPTGYYSVAFRWSGVVNDDDLDGVVTASIGQDIPGHTIWCFADGKTGQYIVATPGGAPIPQVFFRPSAFRKDAALVSQFAFDYSFLDLLYLEPGVGAWTCTASDGGRVDRDGPNGKTVVSLEDFTPLGQTNGKPRELRPGGVLVAIDLVRLKVAAERLSATLMGQAQ